MDFNNLNWQRKNQEMLNLRREKFDVTMMNAHDLENIGKASKLTDSYAGTEKWHNKLYQKTMCIVREFGKPSIFITITCNPSWPEIKKLQALDPKNALASKHRPDIVSRVFAAKIKKIEKEIYQDGIFGKICGYMENTEWQKRGWPHKHCLNWLADDDKLDSIEDIDALIKAELPPESEPVYRKIVIDKMIHRPCGVFDPESPCMVMNDKKGMKTCKKDYPKRYVNETYVESHGKYPVYRRRTPDNGGGSYAYKMNKKTYELTSRDVVPHNEYLCCKYNCHINVEVVNSVASANYITKYPTKGADKTTFRVEKTNEQDNEDEIKEFLDGRYLSSLEAMWSVLGLPRCKLLPGTLKLDVHLPEKNYVVFSQKRDNAETIATKDKTMLTEFFTLNQNDELARNFAYIDIPKFWYWNADKKKWTRIVRGEIDRDITI